MDTEFQRHVQYMLSKYGAYKVDGPAAQAWWKANRPTTFPVEMTIPSFVANPEGVGRGQDADGYPCLLVKDIHPKPGHSAFTLYYGA